MRKLIQRKLIQRAMLVASAGAIGLLWASPASAQDSDAAAAAVQQVMDNLWLVIAGCLVFLMQAGFAFVEAGLTRAKNLANIMAKNLADMAIGTVAFFIIGYSVAFGDGGDLWGGLGDFFFKESADPAVLNEGGGLTDNVTPAASFFFQVVFAATAVTIASGAMAERTKFVAYLAFSAAMTAVIYPVVVHWTWGGGLIAQMSIGDAVYSDFAGSTIVHLTGGIAALVGAAMLGPRVGKYGPDGSPRAIPGHNIGYAVIGVFILWFGWFGFNAGSELAADNLVPFLAMNTLIAASAGVLGATAVIWKITGTPDVAIAGNGALAGLVSITAPVGAVEPWAALVIGFIGGLIVVFAVLGIDRIRIDDPVGCGCGAWRMWHLGHAVDRSFRSLRRCFLGSRKRWPVLRRRYRTAIDASRDGSGGSRMGLGHLLHLVLCPQEDPRLAC